MPALSWPRCCKRVQAQIGEIGRLGMAVDGEDAAFLVQFVERFVERDFVKHAPVRANPSRAFSQTSRSRSTGESTQVTEWLSIRNRSFHCNADAEARDAVLARDLLDRFGRGRGNQDARRAFMEQRELGLKFSGQRRWPRRCLRWSISASATASPPSPRSCADSASPALTISRIAACTRFS